MPGHAGARQEPCHACGGPRRPWEAAHRDAGRRRGRPARHIGIGRLCRVRAGPGGETCRLPIAGRLARGLLIARHDPCHGHPHPAAPHPGSPDLARHTAGRWRAWLCGRDGGRDRSRNGQPGCRRRATDRAGGLGGVYPGTERRDRAGWRRAADPCPVRSVPAWSRGGHVRAERKAPGGRRYGEAHRQAGQPGGQGCRQGRNCRGGPGPANAGCRYGFGTCALTGSGSSGHGPGRFCRTCRAAVEWRGCGGGRGGWRSGRAGYGHDGTLAGRRWACPSQRRTGTAVGSGGGAGRGGWHPNSGQRRRRGRRRCSIGRAGRCCNA